MPTWHPAPAIVSLRDQLNAAFPSRDKRSDGIIGDARHKAEAGGSDHNPDASGTVCAIDVTHGPFWHVATVDGHLLAQQLVASGDARIKYVIFERKIWTPGVGWHAYSGVSPHLEHVHVSVTQAGKNNGSPWRLPMFGVQPPALQPQTIPPPPEDDDDMQWFRKNNGDIIRVAGNTYAHLTPASWNLDAKFGATAVPVDDATYAGIVADRSKIVAS